MSQSQVSIHIDKKHYTPPNPTTGHALYELGSVQSGFDLFLETPGPGDDILIKNDSAPVTLKDGAHLYTSQQVLNPGAHS